MFWLLVARSFRIGSEYTGFRVFFLGFCVSNQSVPTSTGNSQILPSFIWIRDDIITEVRPGGMLLKWLRRGQRVKIRINEINSPSLQKNLEFSITVVGVCGNFVVVFDSVLFVC